MKLDETGRKKMYFGGVACRNAYRLTKLKRRGTKLTLNHGTYHYRSPG
ncbi:MAG TPA: hypothetical protein VHA52_13160 [Candidatus Babeliaceae bacterium]|nr:hypothetical protein [Candidatus Babeliaceae bacterium]